MVYLSWDHVAGKDHGRYGENRARSSTGDRRLLRITWPFLLIVVVLVLLASESLRIVSASRAYVGGESLWSKAQKEAVYSLYRYAQSHAESDYRAYRDADRRSAGRPPRAARAREGCAGSCTSRAQASSRAGTIPTTSTA